MINITLLLVGTEVNFISISCSLVRYRVGGIPYLRAPMLKFDYCHILSFLHEDATLVHLVFPT